MISAMAQGLAGAGRATSLSAENDDLGWLIQTVESMLRQAFPTLVIVGAGSATYFNEACRELALPPSAIQGGALADIAPSFSSKIASVLDAAWNGVSGTAEGVHLQIDRVDGSREIWINAAVSPVMREGRVCALLCVLRDATEERQLRARLAVAEATLSSIAELAPAFLWRLDARGGVRWMNGRCQEYLGLGLKEAREHGWTGWLHPCDRDGVLAEWGRSAASAVPFESRHRLRDVTGGHRWFVVRALPQFDETHDLVEWHAAAVETLDRDGRTPEVDRRLLWVAGPTDWARRYLNADATAGWPSSSASGSVGWHDHLDSVVEEDRQGLRNAFETLLAGRPADVAYRVRNSAGDILSVLEKAYPLVEKDGSIGQLVGEARIQAIAPAEMIMIDPGRRGGSLKLGLEGEGFRVRASSELAQVGRARGTAAAAIYCSDSTVHDILRAAEMIARDLPGLPLVVLGDPVATPREIMALHKAGVSDLLSYSAAESVKLRAIRESLEYLNKSSDKALLGSDAKGDLIRLSPREREILELAVAGGTSKTIGRSLSLSPRTVDFHRSKALDKLGLKAVSQASDLFPPLRPYS